MRFTRFLWPLLVAAMGGCGDQATGPELPREHEDQLQVSLAVEPDTIVPGESSTVTIGAQLPDTLQLALFQLSLSGLGGDTVLQLPITGPGSHQYWLEIHVPTGPIEGTLDIGVLARVGTEIDSARASLVIRDDGPPELTLTVAEFVEPPDSLVVSYWARDAAGITSVRIQIGGAVEWNTYAAVDYQPSIEGRHAVWIPPATHLGDSLTVRVTTTDGFGKAVVLDRVVRLADTTAPAMVVRIDTVPHPELDQTLFPLVFFPGDTLRIDLAASDNHSLTSLGYRMLTFGDSVTPASTTDSVHFELQIPPGTNDPDAYIDVFATDSSGNRAARRVYAVAMDGSFRPIVTLDPYASPLIDWDQQGNYALDVARDMLYVADFGTTLSVVALNSLTQQVIDFGTFVRSVDLTVSGDTVVVLLEGRPNLLVTWDVDRGPSVTDTIPLSFGEDCDAWDMQVAANGHALVTGWSRSGCPTVDVDLTTRVRRFRDVPPALRSLERSGDQRTIVLWNQDDAAIYWSDEDSLSSVRNLFPYYPAELAHVGPSIDHAGTVVLIRNRLYQSDLTDYRWILPDPGWSPSAHALSADGATAFIGNFPGYWKVDVATGAVLERVVLPRFPWRMIAHPDGQRLIVFGWLWLGVVDLR